jgi:hypothetical protein
MRILQEGVDMEVAADDGADEEPPQPSLELSRAPLQRIVMLTHGACAGWW